MNLQLMQRSALSLSGDLDATKRFIGFPTDFHGKPKRESRADGGEMRSSQAMQRLLRSEVRESHVRFGEQQH